MKTLLSNITKTEKNQKFKSEEKELNYLGYKTTRQRGILQVEDDRLFIVCETFLAFPGQLCCEITSKWAIQVY